MAPELNWTSIAETFLKSLFGYLSKKRKGCCYCKGKTKRRKINKVDSSEHNILEYSNK